MFKKKLQKICFFAPQNPCNPLIQKRGLAGTNQSYTQEKVE